MNLGFASPWIVVLALLAVLPFLPRRHAVVRHPWLALIPADTLGAWLGQLRKVLAALAILLTSIGLAEPYRGGAVVEQVVTGAEIVLLIDRSRSMDLAFGSGNNALPDANLKEQACADCDTNAGVQPSIDTRGLTKGQIARGLVMEFVRSRANDFFSLVLFSTHPLPVLGFTDRTDIVQAAVRATAVGRGLGETDVGAAVLRSLEEFKGRPYRGARVVVLISDGGAQLDPFTQQDIVKQMQDARASLFWIYLRSRGSPGLKPEAGEEALAINVPEQALHGFFSKMGSPYRAYQAEDTKALARAVADVSRLTATPLVREVTLPRLPLAPYFFAIAALLAVALAALMRWQGRAAE